MASVSLFNLSAGTALAAGDLLVFCDISDTTQSANGSDLNITVTNFFATVPVPIIVTSASANALAVGRLGSTTPAFTVDASTASQVAGLKVTGAGTGGTVAVVVTDSGANASLTINAKGSGTIGIGSVSTGAVTITPATTISAKLTVTQGTANTANFVRTGYSLTGSDATSAETWTGTLNTTGVPTVLSYALTVTATDAASLFFNYLGGAAGATSLLKMTTAGAITAAGSFTAGAISGTTGVFSSNVATAGALSSWASYIGITDIGTYGSFTHNAADVVIGNNARYNGGWKYKNTAAASLLSLNARTLTYYTAASGTAGDAITFTSPFSCSDTQFIVGASAFVVTAATGNTTITGATALDMVAAASGTHGAAQVHRFYKADGTTVKGGAGYWSNDVLAYTLGSRTANGTTVITSGNSVTSLSFDSAGAATFASTVTVGGTISQGGYPLIGLDANNHVLLGSATWAAGNVGALLYDAAANFPAGAAGRNGYVGVDSTNNRFIYYSGGNRYYVAGTAF